MSNVRLYGTDVAQAEGQGGMAPANPQAVLADATESFVQRPTVPGFGGAKGPRTITLRRTGARPYRFQGTEICSAVGWAEKLAVWHEINIFQSVAGKVIVDVRVFRKSPTERDLFHVEERESIEDAISFLESYDPTQDVLVDIPLDDPAISLAELSLNGIVLRQRIDQTRRQYDALLGDLLHEIERQL
ncbi:MAG: hypothetical protein ACFB6R_00745 [Alphaproteobacteria bacterium]